MYFIGQFIYNQFTQILYKYYLCDPNNYEYYHSNMLNATVKRNKTLHKDIMNDYDKQCARGRVFEFKDIGPVIVVGEWIADYPEAIDMVKQIFNLPDDTEILVHKHWNIDNNHDFI